MSPILSAILFTAAAAAEVTTSMWMPAAYSNNEIGFYGSVVGADGDRLTLAMVYDNETTEFLEPYENTPGTVTFEGSTSFGSEVTTTEAFDSGEMTISVGCSIKPGNRGSPTCVYSSNGPAVFSSYCSYYSSYSEVITSTELYTFDADENNPATVVTRVETYDYRDMIPEFCLSESTLPESLAIATLTMGRNSLDTYQVVITAGEEKLQATAGATPTSSAASATATAIATGTSTSQAAQSEAPSSSPTGTAAATPPAETGAAAPLVTMAPTLAGLGAAIAAFVL